MKIDQTEIADTFAEAFDMSYVRLIVTASDSFWLDRATAELTGYGSSVIGCDLECGIETHLTPEQTPDGRVGASVLAFGFSPKKITKAITNRIGQSVMTCPTTAVYNGLASEEVKIDLGNQLRYFGDGFQKSKQILQRRLWRIPVMDGEFLVEDQLGVGQGIGGGNLIFQTENIHAALCAAKALLSDIEFQFPDTILPFPGGVVRSGSKVGSKYPKLVASTAEAYCPVLRGRVPTALADEANAVLELVVNGTNRQAIERLLQTAIQSLIKQKVLGVGAGNYEGKLGKHCFYLKDLL